jgi:hypothetical protein
MATPSQSPLWHQLLSWFAILTLITIAVIDTLVSKQDRSIAIFSFIILALNLIFGCLQAIPSIRKHLTHSWLLGIRIFTVTIFLILIGLNIFIISLLLTKQSASASTTPSPATISNPTVASSSPTQSATPPPVPPTPVPPTPVPPTQTLATFCTDMKAGNNADAKTQFTPQGWLQFQPLTDPKPRQSYRSCTYDPIPTSPNKTVPGHLVVVTIGNNLTYRIDLTLILDGNSWKIDSWTSHEL